MTDLLELIDQLCKEEDDQEKQEELSEKLLKKCDTTDRKVLKLELELRLKIRRCLNEKVKGHIPRYKYIEFLKAYENLFTQGIPTEDKVRTFFKAIKEEYDKIYDEGQKIFALQESKVEKRFCFPKNEIKIRPSIASPIGGSFRFHIHLPSTSMSSSLDLSNENKPLPSSPAMK